MENMGVYKDEDLVKYAYQICRWHHERYDGKGYPDGLVGEKIPIASQVVSLADVYERLISGEKTGSPVSEKEAIESVIQGKQGAFNPILLECLAEIKDKLQENVKADYNGKQNYILKNKIMKDIEEYEQVNSRLMEEMSEDVKREISSAAESPVGGQNWKLHEMYDD